ncbi:hypothetical protein [Phytoactinopolyspora limicola]|nr:hypothetical protein [Phytoactinopolyspora limicola]
MTQKRVRHWVRQLTTWARNADDALLSSPDEAELLLNHLAATAP